MFAKMNGTSSTEETNTELKGKKKNQNPPMNRVATHLELLQRCKKRTVHVTKPPR